MDWPDRAGFTIGAVALLTSAVTAYRFVEAHGGDLMHQLATPFCLEALALVALARKRVWMFWPPFIVAVAVNVWHGYPNHVLMGVYALPPVAAIMAGHALLRRGSPQSVEEPVDEPVETRVDTPAPVPAHTNGHKLHTGRVTIAHLRSLFGSNAAIDEWYAGHSADTWEAAWNSIGATINQGNQLRREYRKAGK